MAVNPSAQHGQSSGRIPRYRAAPPLTANHVGCRAASQERGKAHESS